MKNNESIIERYKFLKENGLSFEELRNYKNYEDLIDEDTFDNELRFINNRRQKRYRTTNLYKEMYQISLCFENATMIFISIDPNNELLEKQKRTYTKKMNEWIKKHCIMAIVNKEFGETTGREHYHAIALTTEKIEKLFHENGKPKKSNSGYDMYEFIRKDFSKVCKCKEIQFEPTINLINDPKRQINYLLKLNNHSNKKSTTGRIRVLRSDLINILLERQFF